MKLRRIIAVLWQEFFVTIRAIEVIVDLFFFPLVNIVVFGFLSIYLSGTNKLAGQYVLVGMLLWQIIWIVEYSVSVGSLWNIWSRNLSNMFIAPLKASEYILAHTLSGIIKALIVVGAGSVISYFAFGFNILDVGILPLILTTVNFSLFAFSMGVAILGLIFRFGTRIQALAWGLVTIFQPLSAAFYPLHVLPTFLQYVAYLFPSTFTFEAVRAGLSTHTTDWSLFGIAFAENIFYCIVCIFFFRAMFKKSRDSGQFVRNES